MTSTELKQKVKALGLDPAGKSVKELQQVISMAQWAKDHPGEEFPEQFDPMLAKDITKASPDWINKNFKDTDWFIQKKVNGMRSILILYPDGRVRMTSRSRSVKDFMFTPHQDNVLGFQNIKSPFKGVVVLDGELFSEKTRINTGETITESPLQAVVALVHMDPKKSLAVQKEYGGPLVYNCFDCMVYDGTNVEDQPYESRDILAGSAVEMIRKLNPDLPIKKVPVVKTFEEAYSIFKEFIENGEEGIMLKARRAKYQQGKRSNDMVKVKGTVTVDGFISGWVPASEDKGFKDLIGGFKISAFVDGVETEIAAVSNIPLEIRRDATITNDDGTIDLNPRYLHKTVEMVGQEFGKNRRLGSARINEWRPDKDYTDCKLTIEDISPKDWSKNDITDAVIMDDTLAYQRASHVFKDNFYVRLAAYIVRLMDQENIKISPNIVGNDIVIDKSGKDRVSITINGKRFTFDGIDRISEMHRLLYKLVMSEIKGEFELNRPEGNTLYTDKKDWDHIRGTAFPALSDEVLKDESGKMVTALKGKVNTKSVINKEQYDLAKKMGRVKEDLYEPYPDAENPEFYYKKGTVVEPVSLKWANYLRFWRFPNQRYDYLDDKGLVSMLNKHRDAYEFEILCTQGGHVYFVELSISNDKDPIKNCRKFF